MRYIKARNSGSRRAVPSFVGGVNNILDSSVLSEGSAKYCKNFAFSSGALTDGYGLESQDFYPYRTVKVWDFERFDFDSGEYITHKMCCNSYGAVYFYYDGLWWSLVNISLDQPPLVLVYRLYGVDTLFLITPNCMVTWDGTSIAQVVEDAPSITTFAVHYERMFATTTGESNSIYFSDDLDLTNWSETLTEGGFIQLIDERGKLLKVVSYLNYIYIFREYGISRLTAYADQSDFTVVNLYMSGGRIYSGSISACGDEITLLCSDGLFTFDGYSMTKILDNIKFLPSPNAVSYYADGKYYLACRVDGDDTESEDNSSLLVYDVISGEYVISGVALEYISGTEEGVFGGTYDGQVGLIKKCGKLFDDVTDKVWQSGDMMFGMPEFKTLSQVSFSSDSAVSLIVTADGVTHTF